MKRANMIKQVVKPISSDKGRDSNSWFSVKTELSKYKYTLLLLFVLKFQSFQVCKPKSILKKISVFITFVFVCLR